MGKAVEQTHCPNPECNSKDAYTIYKQDDGSFNAYCYSCKSFFKDPYKYQNESDSDVENTSVLVDTTQNVQRNAYKSNGYYLDKPFKISSVQEAESHPIKSIPERRISLSTCERFGVRQGVDTKNGVDPVYYLFPRKRKGKLTGYKQRIVEPKNFIAVGDCKGSDLFGIDLIPNKGKKLFITEGEIDCLSLYQVLKYYSNIPDWEPAVVSLPDGASSAVKSISRHLDVIQNYDQVILVFDNDAPGEEAAEAVCKMLAGKVYVAHLDEKDPNEMLLKGKSNELRWAVMANAVKYSPDGIVNAKDCKEEYDKKDNSVFDPFPPFMEEVNNKIYGSRPGTIVYLAAGTGLGKTQLFRETVYHYIKTTDDNIAVMSLEEDIGDTMKGLVSLELNKRIYLPDVEVEKEEEDKAWNELFGSGRISFYKHMGGLDDDSLFSALKYFAYNGHKKIFLDHLSIVVSEFATEGNERERIDSITTKLFKFVKETGVTLYVIMHLKKTYGMAFEEGAIPSLDDLKGSTGPKQTAWELIVLSRNTKHPDPICRNTIRLDILKSRSTGRTGECDYVYFDDHTGRYTKIPKPDNYEFVEEKPNYGRF